MGEVAGGDIAASNGEERVVLEAKGEAANPPKQTRFESRRDEWVPLLNLARWQRLAWTSHRYRPPA